VTRVVLLSPTTLLGKELIEKLGERPDLALDLHLLSLDDAEVGALTDAAGAAALVRRAEPADLAAADVVFVCGDAGRYRDLLAQRSPEATVVLLDPGADVELEGVEAVPVVAGLNLDQALPGRVLVSPHPGTVLLAHLLAPLVAAGGVREAVATLVQPASLFDRAGLDELYEQSRRLVALQPQEPSEVFGRQLAFNLYPAKRSTGSLAARARQVLGVEAGGLPLAVHLLQGGVFHGFSALLHLHLEGGPAPDEVRRRLAANPLVELAEPDADGEELLGPIDVAATDKVLVGRVEAEADGGAWVWAVMDNLTRGGASNAAEILAHLAAAQVH
jgi:aspartate-semialdehyde dehydrogenase